MKRSVLAVATAPFLLALVGCKGAPPKAESKAEPHPAASAVEARPGAKSFGEAIEPGPVVNLGKVLDNPREYAGKTVTVEGDVRRVCKKMGCWMELATGMTESDKGCRVFFGAHQFFVPKDSDGSRALVQGQIQVKQVQPDFVEHLEEEGAEFEKKNSDGSADEVRLVASGVELWRS